MWNAQHVKTVVANDKQNGRLRFQSVAKRSQSASADVLRKRSRFNARESMLHFGESFPKNKKQKILESAIPIYFQEELDLVEQQNGSIVFAQLYQTLWPHTRSLPEILHHLPRIIDTLLQNLYTLEQVEEKNEVDDQKDEDKTVVGKSDEEEQDDETKKNENKNPSTCSITLATTDIFHLLAVLTKDVRHEIQPYLERIFWHMTRLLILPIRTTASSTNQILDVSMVEALFRSMAFMLQYSASLNTSNTRNHEFVLDLLFKKPTHLDSGSCCLLYTLLGHGRAIVRRLSAETFCRLFRSTRLKSSESKQQKQEQQREVYLQNCWIRLWSETKTQLIRPKQMQYLHHGIALLSWNAISGTRGTLHSQMGRFLWKWMLEHYCQVTREQSDEMTKTIGDAETMETRASLFLNELLVENKILKVEFVRIWDLLIECLQRELKESTKNGASTLNHVLGLVKLVQQMLCTLNVTTTTTTELAVNSNAPKSSSKKKSNKHDIVSMQQLDTQQINDILSIAKNILEENDDCCRELEPVLLKLLCETWKRWPRHQGNAAAKPLGEVMALVLLRRSCLVGEVKPQQQDQQVQMDLAWVVVKELVPHVSWHVLSECFVAHALMKLVLLGFKHDAKSRSCLELVFAVATCSSFSGDMAEKKEDSDDLWRHLQVVDVQSEEKKKNDDVVAGVTDVCLRHIRTRNDDDDFPFTTMCIECLPFLACLHIQEATKMAKALAKFLETTSPFLKDNNDNHDDENIENALVCSSRCIDALATIMKLVTKKSVTKPFKKAIRTAIKHVEQWLLKHAHSMGIIKACANFQSQLQGVLGDSKIVLLSDQSNHVFELLTKNLASTNHFLRLHTLEILTCYPKRPYIVDHADLDWTDDLDEEHDQQTNNDATNTMAGPKRNGLCDLMDTLLYIESKSISIETERDIVSCLSRMQVLFESSGQRIPIAYAEAASHYLLGTLYIKFAPIWPASVKTLQALAQQNDVSSVSEPLCRLLHEMVVLPTPRKIMTTADATNMEGHFARVKDWSLNNNGAALFQDQIDEAQSSGLVSRHLTTDEECVFESIMKVWQKCPSLTAQKSRQMVDIFLHFLTIHYFRFHSMDPDARELCLDDLVPEIEKKMPEKQWGRKAIHERLTLFLKVFAAVSGPKQLYKHDVLLRIFTAFLSHPEAEISQVALDCVIRFKLPHVSPYGEELRNLIKKERDTVLNFQLARDETKIHMNHRQGIIPVLSRIAFGRMAANSSNSHGKRKNARDSPAARRRAVVSFLSHLDDHELFPFLYLMLRNYLPPTSKIRPMESEIEENNMMEWENSILKQLQPNNEAKNCLDWMDQDFLGKMPPQRHAGFLNLLSTVISQMGHSLRLYVPTFVLVIQALGEFSAVSSSSQFLRSVANNYDRNSMRSIRTSCFRCLADLLDQFGETIDFKPCSVALWRSLLPSIQELPKTAQSDKTPSLLHLLEVISSSPKLVPLLCDCQPAVEAVVQCVGWASTHAVMTASLNFINNLMANGGVGKTQKDNSEQHNGPGVSLILGVAPLLLKHFADRLGGGDQKNDEDCSSKVEAKCFNTQTMWTELSILCQISNVILHSEGAASSSLLADQTVLNSLSTLLLPFLGHPKASESDKLNVLGILAILVPKISSGVALEHMGTLSGLLGSKKGSASQSSSLLVRQAIASVIRGIGEKKDEDIPPQLLGIALAVERLCAVSARRVDEIDFESVLSTLGNLSSSEEENGQSWVGLAKGPNKETNEESSVKLLSPLVQICFHLLCSDDAVVSRSAGKAIRALVKMATEEKHDKNKEYWSKFVESNVVPNLRQGLSNKNDATKRLHILILAQVSRCFHGHPSPHLYGDLHKLARDDNPDLDFFLNITHVQMHRRCKAFQRLRAQLNDESCQVPFSMHSLSNILLPLTMNPIYESKTNLDENLALESIATAGAITRHLSWSKYHSTLWTTLGQIQRNQTQERYLIGLTCTIIDNFRFDIVSPQQDEEKSAVQRALENRIIPRIEALMKKETIDSSRRKKTVLRPPVVLALMKLFQKFPAEFFETKLPRILALMCDSLKSRDVSLRDVARSTLAKMAAAMDISHLQLVVRYIAHSLKEGYQLHVRNATLHSILVELSRGYSPTMDSDSIPGFDKAIPLMMDLIYKDIFGEASEFKDVTGVQKQYIKEAAGSKSFDSIEIISRLLVFQPTRWIDENVASSTQVMVSPLFDRLKSGSVDSKTMGRVRECFSRIVIGLSRNPTVSLYEALPFVQQSIQLFTGLESKRSKSSPDDESSDEEEEVPKIRVSGSAQEREEEKAKPKKNTGSMFVWRPSETGTSKNHRDAVAARQHNTKALTTVKDGVSAPKLTGSGRQGSVDVARGLNDPANVCAVIFALKFLYSTFKKHKIPVGNDEMNQVLDPLVVVLTACISNTKNDEVLLVALRAVAFLLRRDLPSALKSAKIMGARVLDILSSSGTITRSNQELVQSAFKALTLLFQLGKLKTKNGLPLNLGQMQVLISFIQANVADPENINSTLGLIKIITSRQFISSEFYDLMKSILDLTVQSPRTSLRQQCSTVFLQYLIDYPMGKKKLDQHLKQMISNLKYQHDEGRLSAVELVLNLIERFPTELLDEHAQQLFLPLVLQLVNEESSECRETISRALGRLIGRVSPNVVLLLHEYTMKWSTSDGTLREVSLQLLGIFIESRDGYFGRQERLEPFLDTLATNMKDTTKWEYNYFALICFEKLVKCDEYKLDGKVRVWGECVKLLKHDNLWVKLASLRILDTYFATLDPKTFLDKGHSFLKHDKGILFEIAKFICAHLEAEEERITAELSVLVVKTLTWIVQVMHKYPSLCFIDEPGSRTPMKWCMTRLSQVAKTKGSQRRETVFKCFAAFCTVCSSSLMEPFVEQMLEPLHRSITEHESHKDIQGNVVVSSEANLAKEVFQIIEQTFGESDVFIKALSTVKTRAQEKRESRKEKLAREAIVDPQRAAERRMKRQAGEKRRRKRRRDDIRSGKKKRTKR